MDLRRDSTLSRRELEVLNHLQLGLTNREIARRLFVSTNTVNKHVHQVLKKLEVTNRVQAAMWALRVATLVWFPTSGPISARGATLVLGLTVAVLSIALDLSVRRRIGAGERHLPQGS